LAELFGGEQKLKSQQGCHMVCFQTRNPNLGLFWRDLEWKLFFFKFYDHLEYFLGIWYNLWQFWYVLEQEKSGNAGSHLEHSTSFALFAKACLQIAFFCECYKSPEIGLRSSCLISAEEKN
jgi:hypothetical protein